MQPTLTLLPRSPEQTLYCFRRVDSRFDFDWHHHREYELTWIGESHGRRFVGDAIEEYQPGELVLLGPHLPHTWASSAPAGPDAVHEAVVITFDDDWVVSFIDHCPEFRAVSSLLQAARSGVVFDPERVAALRPRIEALVDLPATDQLLELLAILQRLADDDKARQLVSDGYLQHSRSHDARAQRMLEHILNHVDQPLQQADVAARVGMTPAAFSRFFRRVTGRGFVEYVHELRVGQACRLLIETDWPVSRICFEVGFGNLANFNRVFRRLKAMPPRGFRQRFAQPAPARDAASSQSACGSPVKTR
ncbi:helix-turn-helix domain-containing protein [Phycisphaerales bacterium AB-hyl4]|uniref:Helix-turn-helix domain-containing protein n=1 Tax=Natronomicrosphaera hydrolytica TaxID=3242702 RepID=A0ABV4U2J9_9BACT